MIPFEFMALITALWVIIGAIFIMPHFAERKMTRKGGRIDKLESGFHKRLDRMEKKIPKDIPTMKEIQAERAKTTENLMKFQKSIPKLLIQTVQTEEFETAVKSYEGRMYRAKGIDMAQAQKGIDAAEKIFLEKIQNQDPDHEERNEMLLIVKDSIKIAEDMGYIEEGSTDQKMGVVQGILGIYDRLQRRNNGSGSSSSLRGGYISSPPPNFKGGSELENYYR